MDKKRLGFIILFVLSVLVIGYMIYRVFFAVNPPPVTPDETPTTNPPIGQFPTGSGGSNTPGTNPNTDGTGQLPVSGGVFSTPGGSGGPVTVNHVTSDYVTSVAVAPLATGLRYYNRQDGHFYHVLPNGVPELLTDEIFYNVDKVTWSQNQNTSILEYPDGANIFYDFTSKQQVTLPKQWEDFSFSPDGNAIAAKSIGLSPENRWLIAANPDGTNIALIEPLGDNGDKVTVNWSPNKQIIALSATGDPLGADRQKILMIGQNGENFRALTVEGRDMQSLWSPSGQKILYSVYNAANDFKPALWIDRGDGDNIGTDRKLLNVNTWANKCTFGDDRFVYCGVPRTLAKGAGFAPQIANNTPDDLYRIDTNTGFRTSISLTEDHVIDTISVDPTNHQLYFTDKNTPGIFSVNL